MRPGVRARLTLWYGLSTAAVLIACGSAVRVMAHQALVERIDVLLRGEFDEMRDRFQGGAVLRGHQPYLLSLTRDDGSIVVRSRDFPAAAGDGELLADPRTLELPHDTRCRAMSGRLSRADGSYVLLLMIPLGEVEAEVRTLVNVMLAVFPAALAASMAGGWWLAGRALSPLIRMTEAARRIGDRNLNERLPAPPPLDELGAMAATVNRMLDRLQAAFESQHRFTADASHELMTPLAVMRAEVDVTLRADRTPAEYRDALSAVRDETVRLTRLAEVLLCLARQDGAPTEATASVDLGDVLRRSVDALRPAADAKGIALTIVDMKDMSIRADPDRLPIAFTNLIDNAIKCTPTGGSVTVAARADGDACVVEVRDTGIGIAPADIPRLFERFYRVDKSRSRQLGGFGLGLSIASGVVEAHGGRIEVESREGAGSVFRVVLPGHIEDSSNIRRI